MRLDKFISSQRPDISRSMVKELCRKGMVSVNGQTVKKPDTHIDESRAEICVNGERISYREHLYIMLNKPRGVVCSSKGGRSRTVLEIIPEEYRRSGLFPAGRLDKDTEGFVLLTDDGELAHKMLSPKSHVPKTYFARLEKPWEEGYAEAFAGGMTIDGNEKCLPAEFKGGKDPFECTLVLHEGKFHQVKRMFQALGNRVVYLRRISIGSLPLDPDLPLGKCLEILHKDVEKLLAR
ncbi:pseudouridine synthase [Ruminococcus sp. Marseille-P6503]|uniref:pseudouridine synthase n=1 Tax=Ruminococcus sp. Marseille-P6503 TaxID=2364796 RepID=UPI000F539186|nr:pseudouridine synthase [Ruminococcus sp. Marseille-P6503]